jgi:hypothetical protein
MDDFPRLIKPLHPAEDEESETEDMEVDGRDGTESIPDTEGGPVTTGVSAAALPGP